MKTHPPTKSHNYVAKMVKLVEAGEIPAGLQTVDIKHDDWCDLMFRRGYCNCDPEIALASFATSRFKS